MNEEKYFLIGNTEESMYIHSYDNIKELLKEINEDLGDTLPDYLPIYLKELPNKEYYTYLGDDGRNRIIIKGKILLPEIRKVITEYGFNED